MLNERIVKEIGDTSISGRLCAAIESGELREIDYYIVRDVVELCGMENPSGLYSLLISMCKSINKGGVCSIIDAGDKNIDADLRTLLANIETLCKKAVSFEGMDADAKPVIYLKSGDKFYFYFNKLYFAEKLFADTLKEKLGLKERINIPHELREKVLGNTSYNFKQKLAIYLSMTGNFTVISGGPGTGKTYVISEIIKHLIASGIKNDRIRVAAPTGKAAKRFSESLNDSDIGITGETIHKLLDYSMSSGIFRYNENNKLDCDFIIIDEVSMVDMVLMKSLLAALKETARIVLVGDKDQLPSVAAGAVLSDILRISGGEKFSHETASALGSLWNGSAAAGSDNLFCDRIIILDESLRTKGDALKAAAEFNSGNTDHTDNLYNLKSIDNFAPFIKDDQHKTNIALSEFIRGTEYQTFIRKVYGCFYNDNYFDLLKVAGSKITDHKENVIHSQESKELWDIIKKIDDITKQNKILTALNEGIYGCSFINGIVKDTFYNKDLSGIPIIVKSNNYDLGLFNGDTGFILSDKTGRLWGIFMRDNNSFHKYHIGMIGAYDLAAAITIHKSQGSQYENAVIILPDNPDNPLLTREILYTGITRVKGKVVINSSRPSLRKAVSAASVRESGLEYFFL